MFTERSSIYTSRLAATHLIGFGFHPKADVDHAIVLYQQVLNDTSRRKNEMSWRELQFNLGNAYFSRVSGKRKINLKQALFHYQKALNGLEYNNSHFIQADDHRANGESIDRVGGMAASSRIYLASYY